MIFGLVRRRTVWWPTVWGWCGLMMLSFAPSVLWWFFGESFLSTTQRLPAEVLVVEGWIGAEGVHAAAVEFAHGGYRYIVTTSGLTGESWSQRRWSFAREAEEQLRRSLTLSDKIFVAEPRDTETQRTVYSSVQVL